jgi:NAD(P)-dependent dehydrogenase (short-subunit alcohol dehydrogenase family)
VSPAAVSAAGKVGLVTGGARGIGAAIAGGLRAIGAKVAVLDLDADALAAHDGTRYRRSSVACAVATWGRVWGRR